MELVCVSQRSSDRIGVGTATALPPYHVSLPPYHVSLLPYPVSLPTMCPSVSCPHHMSLPTSFSSQSYVYHQQMSLCTICLSPPHRYPSLPYVPYIPTTCPSAPLVHHHHKSLPTTSPSPPLGSVPGFPMGGGGPRQGGERDGVRRIITISV